MNGKFETEFQLDCMSALEPFAETHAAISA